MIEQLFQDKTIKAKDKVTQLAEAILKKEINVDTIVDFVKEKKDKERAMVMEALEKSTKSHPELANETVLHFAMQGLESTTPNLLWESARVLGNTASQFKDHLVVISKQLMKHTDHEGTVVRWSMAYALGEIILLKSDLNSSLIPKATTIAENEEKNSIKKIYQSAIKKVNKS